MAPPSPKKRTRLTLSEQAEATRLLRSGTPAAHLMHRFKISRRTTTSIKKNAEKILQLANTDGRSLKSQTVRDPAFPLIDKEVYDFTVKARALRYPVTQAVITKRALLAREKIHETDLVNEVRKKVFSFSALKGWLQVFIRRHALRSIALHGEGGSVDAGKVQSKMRRLRDSLEEFDVECIFNVDETGLFYKLLSSRTYVATFEDRKTVRGTKGMKAKDRITAYVCTNATGKKVPMAIIGKAKNPGCFRLGAPPVPYFNQKNAWSDGATFRRWFYDVFVPFIRRFTSKPVALLMDNCGPHGEDLSDPREQIHIITLPPDCTALHQPMDCGIIAAWKAKYRGMILRSIVEVVENRQKMREGNSVLPAGMRGLSEGYEPHMLDVAKLVQKSWEFMSAETVKRCWIKSKALPTVMEEKMLSSVCGRAIEIITEDTSMLTKMFSEVSLNLHRTDPFYEQTREQLSEPDLQCWIGIEDNPEVREALIEDSLCDDRVEGDVTDPLDGEAESDSTDDLDLVSPLPPLRVILDHFQALEIIAFNSNVVEAVSHMRRARRAFEEAKRKECPATRQLLITEMLE